MGVLKRNCPHCETKAIAFTSFKAVKKENQDIWLVALSCNGCHSGYFVEFKSQIKGSPDDHHGDLDNHQYYSSIREYPRKIENKIPEYLPSNINNFFSQAISALRSDNYDSSAMMSRKVLEVSVKTIHPESSGSLYLRIESLEREGLITNDLKEWAHIIREDGNESAHEEQPVTREFAEEILSFTELFLLYVFTMPGMVKERMPQTE
jgi:HEPN domain-containing protein